MNNNSNNVKNKKTGFRKFAIFIVVISVIAIASGVGIMYFTKNQSSNNTEKNKVSNNNNNTSGKWYERVDMTNKKANWVSWIFYDNITNFPIKSSDIINNFKGNDIYGSVNEFMNYNLEPGDSKDFVEKDTGKSGQTDIRVEVQNNSESNLSVQQCIDNGWISLRAEVPSGTDFIPGDVLNIDSPNKNEFSTYGNYEGDLNTLTKKQLDDILAKYGSPTKIIELNEDGGFYEMIYEYEDFVISIMLTGSKDINYYNFVFYYSKDFWKEHEDELKRNSIANNILGAGYKVVAE